jgi:hypothetical protein
MHPLSVRGGNSFTFRVRSRQLQPLKTFSLKKNIIKKFLEKIFERKNPWYYGHNTKGQSELLLIDRDYIIRPQE